MATTENFFNILEENDNKNEQRLREITELTEKEKKWSSDIVEQEGKWYDAFTDISKTVNTYFNVEHVNKLNIPYDILFFVAKKNIGKTYEIYRLIRELINKGERFIYLRLSKDELTKSLEAFNNDEASPVYMTRDKNTFKFYDKREINEVLELADKKGDFLKVTTKWLKDHGIEFKGYGFEFQFCQSYTGGEFGKFTTVFYDECLSYNPRNVINSAHLANWGAFLSSISRNKKELRVYMFGNLRDTNTQLLDFYGINRDDKLRYIIRGGNQEEGCRILYINAGDLYKGIESQSRAARHSGGSIAYQLQNNDFLTTSNRLIPPKAFKLMNKVGRFVIGRNGSVLDPYLIDLRNYDFDNGLIKKTVWAVSVKKLDGFEDTSDYPIWCEHPAYFLSFSNLTRVARLKPLIKIIVETARFNVLRYLDEGSINLVRVLLRNNPFGTIQSNGLGF